MNRRHRNSENELITIEQAPSGQYEGQYLLVVHDDPPPQGSGITAPMLLDGGTMRFLLSEMVDMLGLEATAQVLEGMGATIEEVGEPGYYSHHGNDGAFVAPGRYLVLPLPTPQEEK